MTKKEIIKYLKTHDFNVQRAKAAILCCDLTFIPYVNSDSIHGIIFSPLYSWMDKRVYTQVIEEEKILAVARKIYQDFKKDKTTFIKKLEGHRRFDQQIDNLWKKNWPHKNDMNDTELIKFFDEFTVLSRKWLGYMVLGEDKGKVIEKELVSKLHKNHNVPVEKAKEIVNILTHLDKQSTFGLERQDFLELYLYVLEKGGIENSIKDGEFIQKFNKYKEKYFWKNTDFYDYKDITLESLEAEIKKEINKRNEKDLLEEISKIKKELDIIRKKKSQLLATLNLNKDEREDLEYASKLGRWIDNLRKVGMMKRFYCFLSLIKEMVKRRGLEYDDVVYLTIDEVKEVFLDKSKLNKKIIWKRKTLVVSVYEKGEAIKFYYDDDAKEIIAATIKSVQTKNGFKGSVASKGGAEDKKIIGKVRIVWDPAKDKFEEGEILVTSMTRVEFTPLMHQAKAIITDEGGIACHAAIVSRELGIPCIIGTKIATTVLKDGDLVEVDVEKGIVKILKRK